MYNDLLPGPVAYDPPWASETLSQRMGELLVGEGERVAYVYGKPDTSTFRYRVFNVIEALRASEGSGVKASWFSADEIDSVRSLLPRLSTLVLARLRYCGAVSDLIAAARAFGVRVLMDCDDLVFDLRYAQLVLVNNDQSSDDEVELDQWYAYVGRLNATAQLCDGGIATNSHLAGMLEGVCGGPVSIIPNFLNRRQEELSRQLLAAKAGRAFRGNGRVMIGYFSGSRTHNKDFRVALDALMQLMDADDAIDMRIVGFMEGHGALSRFGKRVQAIPLQDWLNLQVKIAEVDINIAPLQLNDFTHCKSELKFFESAIVGSYTLASRSQTFERALTEPSSGTLVPNGEWLDALKSAVALVRDSKRYQSQALETAENAYSRYGWNRNTDAILAALRR
jgi:hypothetical protein